MKGKLVTKLLTKLNTSLKTTKNWKKEKEADKILQDKIQHTDLLHIFYPCFKYDLVTKKISI